MHSRVIVLALTLILTVCVFVAPAAAQTPPSNDLFTGAITIPSLGGKALRANNIHLTAPNETGEPNTCPGGFSVWYKFNFPFSGTLSLTTGGSYLELAGGFVTNETSIAIFTGTAVNGLTQQACNDDYGDGAFGEIQAFVFNANTTYYVRVGALAIPVTGSYYLLTARLRRINNWLLAQNPGFENQTLPPWKLVNKSGADKLICGIGVVEHEGECAFKFTNGASENSSLQQTILWPSAILPRSNDTLYMSAYVLNEEPTTTPNLIVSLTVIYSDGTPATVVKRTVTTTSGLWERVLLPTNFASNRVAKVKIAAKNKTTTGLTWFDDVTFNFISGVLRETASGVLPLPPVMQ